MHTITPCSEDRCKLSASAHPDRVRSMRPPRCLWWKSPEWERGRASSAALRLTLSVRGLSDFCQVW